MAFDFTDFNDASLSEDFVDWLVDEQAVDVENQFGRLWEYYQNKMYEVTASGTVDNLSSDSARNYIQGQEHGLPARITGIARNLAGGLLGGRNVPDIQRKEVVIENDISWRINAMVDFLFGKGVTIVSKASDGSKRTEIETILKQVFAANGGVRFFQDMAVLGAIYGFVDCIIRPDQSIYEYFNNLSPSYSATASAKPRLPFNKVLDLALGCGLELIEAQRALPVLDEEDCKRINYYVQHFIRQKNSVAVQGNFLTRLLSGRDSSANRETVSITEIIGPDMWQQYENKNLIAQGPNILGKVPVVHIQNIAQPYYYEGLSDVEPLIPLQDELNTRLSDRASRITFQAFKMYLAKGIEGIENRAVAPGRMWCTDNPEASIEAFGGDTAMPSEDMHIMEIREAMDKTSGVTPVVAGILKGKVGNLSSAVALRMTLMGMLAKTERKQYAYGEGLKRIAQMVLELLDTAGIYQTNSQDRNFDVLFPSPVPENTMEKLQEAKLKAELGLDKQQVLKELGY